MVTATLPIAAQVPQLRRQERPMTRDTRQPRRPTPEDRRFLEALCLWKALYAERGPQDSLCVASITSTITAAEARLRALRINDDRMRRRFIGG
jgi:hypothetical protein